LSRPLEAIWTARTPLRRLPPLARFCRTRTFAPGAADPSLCRCRLLPQAPIFPYGSQRGGGARLPPRASLLVAHSELKNFLCRPAAPLLAGFCSLGPPPPHVSLRAALFRALCQRHYHTSIPAFGSSYCPLTLPLPCARRPESPLGGKHIVPVDGNFCHQFFSSPCRPHSSIPLPLPLSLDPGMTLYFFDNLYVRCPLDLRWISIRSLQKLWLSAHGIFSVPLLILSWSWPQGCCSPRG